ncbi:MAG: T9SS type A sorting domain-containing protein [Ignavibacteriales bacterium]|nr:T9SS type A sorting domain-containing protein [Ignavibacteriales bacterium]
MKNAYKILFFILVIVFYSPQPLTSQALKTNGLGGGNWDSTSTWQGGAIPSSVDDVVIAAGDSVNIRSSITTSINVNSLTIQTGAKVANSFSVAPVALTISGMFIIDSAGWYYANSSSATSWPLSGGYSIHPASNYVQTASGSSTIGAAGRATFGNLINAKAGSGSTCAVDLTVIGNLTIQTGASGTTFRGTYRTNGNLTHHVHGDVKVISGQWVAVDDPTGADGITGVWNVDGNVTVGDPSTASGVARMGAFASADGGLSRFGYININGNLNIINGGRLQCGSSTSSTATTEVGAVNLHGNLTTDATAVFATNSKGRFSLNFIGSGTQTVSLGSNLKFSSTNPNALLTVYDTIATGSNVVFTGGKSWYSSSVSAPNGDGAFVVNGKLSFGTFDTLRGLQAFILNEGATLNTKNPFGIDTLGSIQVKGPVTFNDNANYGFNGAAPQVTGMLLPTTINNLTIDNFTGVVLSKPTTINGILSLVSGVFDNTIPFVLGPSGTIIYGSGSLLIPLSVELLNDLPIPHSYFVDQNYPNPFNPTTTIRIGLPLQSVVKVSVYNIVGQKVADILENTRPAGVHEIKFDAANLVSGIYYYRFQADNFTDIKSMILLK